MHEHTMKNFCASIYEPKYRNIFEDYQSHTSNPVKFGQCPYPAGENKVKRFFIRNAEGLLPPYIPGGEKWRIDARFLRKDEEQGGYNFYFALRSLQSLIGGAWA